MNIKTVILSMFIVIIIITAGSQFYMGLTDTYNQSNLSPAVNAQYRAYYDSTYDNATSTDSTTSLTKMGEDMEGKLSDVSGTGSTLNILYEGSIETIKTLLSLPKIALSLITQTSSMLGIPAWFKKLIIGMILITIALAVLAAFIKVSDV